MAIGSVKQWKRSGCGHLSTDPGIRNSCKGYCQDSTGESCNAVPCPECGAVHYWTGAGWAEKPTKERRCPLCDEHEISKGNGRLMCLSCRFQAREDSWEHLIDEIERLKARIVELKVEARHQAKTAQGWFHKMREAHRWRRVDEEAPPYRQRVEFYDVESFTGMRGDEYIRDDAGLPRNVLADEVLFWRPLGPPPTPGGEP